MWIFWPDMKVMTININICKDNVRNYMIQMFLN